MAVKSILMVCRGNICRSLMAKVFFTHHLNKMRCPITVSSAGISALVEYPADKNALAVMHENNIDLSSHRARQLSDSLWPTHIDRPPILPVIDSVLISQLCDIKLFVVSAKNDTISDVKQAIKKAHAHSIEANRLVFNHTKPTTTGSKYEYRYAYRNA